MKRQAFISFTSLYLYFFQLISASAQPGISGLGQSMDKFGAALQLVNYYYMDSVKNEKLVEDAIEGMLEKLDPHSVYVTPKELKEFNEPLSGNFEGIGIQFNILEDTITVISPIAGGPSDRLGILSGDRIVKIEGENVAGIKIKNEQVLKRLRGDKGTQVKISVFRKGLRDLLDFTIVRDKIPIYSVDASYMAEPGIGYIKLSRFAQTSTEEVRNGIKQLKQQGAKSIILDLQDNGGGLLNAAFEIADEFLTAGKKIVYTSGLHSQRKDYNSTQFGEFQQGRLVVLVDEGSASASEIVSGAVQDWDRGLLIGRRTFGKGLVQNQFPLPDGSALRMTIAQYFTPTGRCIQKPYGKGSDDYYKDLMNRYKRGELVNRDSIKFPDSLIYKTPAGRTVYGGGGIMPDIFIPLDTTGTSKYLTDLSRKGVVNSFALKYADNHRPELKSLYPDFNAFKKGFRITDQMLEELVNAGIKEGVAKDEKGFKSAKLIIVTQLKALLARDLYKPENFFEIINDLNDPYRKALEVLQSKEFESKYKISDQK
ncbi:MAG: S41 family peptidase [Bacteroidota bacterium]|jgi:carboxyl-terminal processing protease